MSLIHIARNNVVLGQFTEEEVRAGLASGTYQATDLAWRAGNKDWMQLSRWPEFAAPGTVPPPILITEAPQAEMPSWERRKELGTVRAFLKSLGEILKSPNSVFSLMNPRGGIGAPFAFLMIPVVISAILQAATGCAVTLSNGHTDMIPKPIADAGAAGVAGYFLVTGILGALLTAFLKPLIVHLFLMLYKGANSGYETTFRASAYATGAVSTLAIPLAAIMLIPVVGVAGMFLMAPIGLYGLVLDCIAISRAHKTDTWRVVMAFLTPGIICCCLYMAAIFVFVGAIAASKGAHP